MRKKRLSVRLDKETTLSQSGQIAGELAEKNQIRNFSLKLGMSPGHKDENGELKGSDLENGTVTLVITEM